MENKLLKQSDIDSLVSELASKAAPAFKAAPAPQRVTPTPDGSPPAPGVKQVSLREAKQQETGAAPSADFEKLVSLNNKLAERLQRIEAKVQRLEQLEKVKAGGGGVGISQAQYQEMMSCIQQLNQQFTTVSANLQGTLGYDIYHSFECEKCGTKSRVATVFRCTQCGHHNWRGW